MGADGSRVPLVTGPGSDIDPAWSPTGDRVAFASDRDGAVGDFDLYIVNADGSNLRRITNDPAIETAPDWSPSGDHVTYTHDLDGEAAPASPTINMVAIGTDGSVGAPEVLTDPDLSAGNAAWSPDGSHLVFEGTEQTEFGSQDALYVLDVTNRQPVKLQTGRNDDGYEPTWTSDGSEIVAR